MSEHDSPPSPPPSHPAPTEEFGVSLDWPEDALADPAGDATRKVGAQHGGGAHEAEGEPDAPADAPSGRGGRQPEDDPAAEVEPVGPVPEVRTRNGAGTAWEVGGMWTSERPLEQLDRAPEEAQGSGGGVEPSGPGAHSPGSTTPWSTALVAPAGLPVRSEGVSAALSALAMRIDALVGASSTSRASIAQRLDDHLDTVGRLARSQIADIAELQHDNERALAEVRRAQQGTEDLVRRLIDRFDVVQGEMGRMRALLDDLGRGQARLPEVAAAITRLEASIELVPVPEDAAAPPGEASQLHDLRGELLAASADQAGVQQELARQVEALREALGALSELPEEAPSEDPELLAALTRVDDRLSRLERRRADPELHETLARLDRRLDALGQAAGQQAAAQPAATSGAAPDLDARLDNLERLVTEAWQAERELHRAVGKALADLPSTGTAASDAALDAVRTELVALRRRISVRAKPEDAPLGAEQLETLADAVVDRLRRVLVVVPEEHGANG